MYYGYDISDYTVSLAERAERDLAEMCEDAARWQRNNPDGYPDE